MTRGLVAGLAIVGLLAACSASDEPSSAGTVERSATASPLDPVFAAGSSITITDTGPEPGTLIAVSGVDIVFLNESGTPVRVVADGGSFNSGRIGVGDTWTFRPDAAVSIAYHADGASGVIQVEPAAAEGEIPGVTGG